MFERGCEHFGTYSKNRKIKGDISPKIGIFWDSRVSWNAKLCLNHIKGGALRFHAVESKMFFNILKTKQTKAIFFLFFFQPCVRAYCSLKFIQKYYSNKYQYKSTLLAKHEELLKQKFYIFIFLIINAFNSLINKIYSLNLISALLLSCLNKSFAFCSCKGSFWKENWLKRIL